MYRSRKTGGVMPLGGKHLTLTLTLTLIADCSRIVGMQPGTLRVPKRTQSVH